MPPPIVARPTQVLRCLNSPHLVGNDSLTGTVVQSIRVSSKPPVVPTRSNVVQSPLATIASLRQRVVPTSVIRIDQMAIGHRGLDSSSRGESHKPVRATQCVDPFRPRSMNVESCRSRVAPTVHCLSQPPLRTKPPPPPIAVGPVSTRLPIVGAAPIPFRSSPARMPLPPLHYMPPPHPPPLPLFPPPPPFFQANTSKYGYGPLPSPQGWMLPRAPFHVPPYPYPLFAVPMNVPPWLGPRALPPPPALFACHPPLPFVPARSFLLPPPFVHPNNGRPMPDLSRSALSQCVPQRRQGLVTHPFSIPPSTFPFTPCFMPSRAVLFNKPVPRP